MVAAAETAAGRRAAAQRNLALPDGSFPVTDAAHWDKARDAIGRVTDPAKRAKVAKLLQRTAPKFGRTAALNQSWAAPGGSQHSNDDLGIYLAAGGEETRFTCPECGHAGSAGEFGASGASLQAKPAALNTQVPNTAQARDGAPLTVRGGTPAHALSSTRAAVELAAGTLAPRRHPVHGPEDVLVRRLEDGTALLRHRNGGAEIARMRQTGNGWVATVNGKDLTPHTIQRAALAEAVGTYNAATRAPSASLQPPPQQTELMTEFGIPAMRSAALATPVTSAGSGPRVTAASGSGKYDPDHDGDNDATSSGDTDKDYAGGLGPRGQVIYKKLIARGFPPARALAFAKNAERFAAKAAAAPGNSGS
jgi:hypothetical protein